MKKSCTILKNLIITAVILCISFLLCLFIRNIFKTDSLIPAIFVLAVFLTSLITQGYIYGILCSLISVLAVNYAFTSPFFKLNFTMPENIVSTVIMIIVTLITGALTTKLKRQEALKAESEKERMRANLLRAVSHDLRTPLTTIYSSTSAILENQNCFTDEQKLKMLHGIKDDAEWLTRMVENLLSITKLDGGNVKIIKTPTVLEELIDSVLMKFNKRYPKTPVNICIPEDFLTIPMDAILIEQVIINILENAVQHAFGMTELALKVSEAHNKVIFEITDNGCGIDAERLKTIFSGCGNDISRPSDGRKTNSGIGLSVCASIIKAHGGDIYAEIPKSGGTSFKFTLDKGNSEDE